MVACTPTYFLPYQEGGDRPCDLGPVWCAFAGIVEAKLTEFDAVLARTATTVPFAQVRKTVAGAGVDGNPIQFDTVSADNDGMVDLSAEPEVVRIRRPGLWIVNYVIRASADANDRQLLTFGPDPLIISPLATPASATVRRWRIDGASTFGVDAITLQSEVQVPVTQADIDAAGGLPLTLTVGISGSAIEPTVTSADLTVYWHCEL